SERGNARDIDIESVRDLKIVLDKVATATVIGHVSGIPEGTVAFVNVVDPEQHMNGNATDASGNFRIENAPAGTVDVQASMLMSGDRPPRSKRVTIDAKPNSETRVDLAFGKESSVHGRVKVNGVTFRGLIVAFHGNDFARGTTKTDGTYEVTLE